METDKKIVSYRALEHRLRPLRKRKKIVVASGTFDLIQLGHLLFLSFAKRQGDILVVGVGSDRIIHVYKGKSRPILTEQIRMRLLAGFSVVDFVVLLDEDPVEKITGQKFFRMLRPDVWVVPYQDHNPEGIRRFAKEIGAKLVRLPRLPVKWRGQPLSTTSIISYIRKLKS